MHDPIEKYGIEILRFLDDRGIQAVLDAYRGRGGEAGPSNETIALAILYASGKLKSIALNNLNRVRRESVSQLLDELTGPSQEAKEKRAYEQRSKEAQQEIIDVAMKMQDEGKVLFSRNFWNERETEGEELVGDEEEVGIFTPEDEKILLSLFKGRKKEVEKEEKIGDFDLTSADPIDIIKYWIPISTSVRRYGGLRLDEIIDKIKDDYSRHVFMLSLDDHPNEVISSEAEKKRISILASMDRRLEIMRTGVKGLVDGTNPRILLTKLNSFFSSDILKDMDEIEKIETPSLAGDSDEKEIIKTLVACACKARREGILYLEYHYKRMPPYLRLGIMMAVDGWEMDYIDRVLKNKKETILAEYEKKMKMFEQVCLGLRNGDSPRILEVILNSYLIKGYSHYNGDYC